MHCSDCGFEVQSGFAFCPRCGVKQPRLCPSCGHNCAPDFTFCPKCGVRLEVTPPVVDGVPSPPLAAGVSELKAAAGERASSSAQPHGVEADADRRTITVLFADLSGFTALSEQLDPEVMQSLQNELFEELTTAVQRFGGFVDKFVGDALLALFGAPAAHEDDPERALRAALDMIDRTARVDGRLAERARVPLTLHIGINTGHVVAGQLGAGRAKSYSVTGDMVNTAQRLQSMASPGEVLVGPLTYRLTRHAFAYDSLGEIALRGRVGSVLVHRLRGPLETPRTARGLEALGLSAPMIGRDAELAHLLSSLDFACSGVAQLVRLVGEAGIGKTRLISEFLARIRDEARFSGIAVRRAACSPLGEQSYGTLAAVLRSAYGLAPKASATETQAKLAMALTELGVPSDEAKRLMPLYFHVLGLGDPEAVLLHVEPAQLRRQIFFAIRVLFERRMALSPLLIIVEDLHWADAVSIEALRFLMDRLERSRLMLLFTHRPMSALDQLDSSRMNHSALRLTPLRAVDGKRMLAAFFGDDSSTAFVTLYDRILARAGGNPLFVEEIVRGLIEVGVLACEAARWRIAVSHESSADIPVSIQAMLLARVDRLPHDALKLAQEAAVIGPRFDAALLRATTSDPARLQCGIDLLCDAEIVEEPPGGSSIASQSYRFTHSLLQDVIYQNLLLQRRTEMHGRIATALEQLCGPDPQQLYDLVQLGHHFSLSANRTKGVRYLRAAGDRARATYANDDAIRLYQQAFEMLTTPNDRDCERLILRERIADLCGPAGQRDAAREHYEAALAAYRADADPVAGARILRKLGRLSWDAGKGDSAEAHYAEAAALLEAVDAPIEQALLKQERGRLAFRKGDHAAAVTWADDALGAIRSVPSDCDAAARLEAARATAEALNTKGIALARLGRNQQAVSEVERSVAVAESAELLNVACRGYTNLGALYTTVDPVRAMDVCKRGLDCACRIGDIGFQARLLTNLAVACCTFTDKCEDEGVPAAQKAIELDRALDQREHLSVPLIALGQIHQCHGQVELAARCYNEALEVARETGEPQQLFPCYDGLATLSLDEGNMPEAERYFALAQDVCSRHQLDPEALILLPFLD